MNSGNADGGEMTDEPDRRRGRRRQVLKRAKLIFGHSGSTIDCLVLDETAFGVQLETPVMTQLPDQLRIRLTGGATYDAVRLWSTGNRVGLHFVGAQIHDAEALRQRDAARVMLRSQDVPSAVHMLRNFGFFESHDLREAAEAAEQAFNRLIALLE